MSPDYKSNIEQSSLTIYDTIETGHPLLWIPSPELEDILNQSLIGFSVAGLALRTRSKVVKEQVCLSLGYPIPKGFQKTQPRFPGQDFDVYIQKSNNLQVWNEDLSPTRRYVIIRVSDDDIITKVKVVTGASLAVLDTTGKLTQKYQARLIKDDDEFELISNQDTELLSQFVDRDIDLSLVPSPIDNPKYREILPVKDIFERLKKLVGKTFIDAGRDQERNRGAALHSLVCEHLGYNNYKDDGRFPDIRQQLLEVKLQTSPTIDLGLVCPDSEAPLDIPQLNGTQVRHCDVRHALFYAKTDNQIVTITNLYLTTGKDFFTRFPQFQGKVLNKKIQIPLPSDFFDD